MTALTELRDKVAAGGTPTRAEWTVVFPATPEDDDYPRSEMARSACIGWVDAALSLMGEVLPGWDVHLIGQRHGGVWEVHLWELDEVGWHLDGNKRACALSKTPARALLLAILDALIAQEQET